VLQQAIDSAQAEVDSYLAGRMRLPLEASEVSAAIKHFTLLVARYYVYADRKTEAVADEYERAVAWLRDVAAGRADAGVTQTALPGATVKGSRIVAPVRTPVFGECFEARYDVPQGPNGSGEFLIGR
jgi:phage gp36-like protein